MKERSPKPEALAKQIAASAAQSDSASGGGGAPYPWPDRCGEIDIRIDRNGAWTYQGSPIGRIRLVKLFASVLRRDGDGGYWLVTPVEAGRIEVEDVPFVAVEVDAAGVGREQVLTMRSNLDEIVTVDAAHPIRVTHDSQSGQPRPYVLIRDDLWARILRPVYYALVDLGVEAEAGDDRNYGVWSAGEFFVLGSLEEGG